MQDRKGLWNEEFVENFGGPSLRIAGLVSGRSLAQATVRAWEIPANVPCSPTNLKFLELSGLIANLPEPVSPGSKLQVTRVRVRAAACFNEGVAQKTRPARHVIAPSQKTFEIPLSEIYSMPILSFVK